ncbi:MAG TPA: peptidase domain-containing ABC transporter [Patescibacteria group bacterium]|nr:peptidase domain-containing ABC transporter [Patescibacteria group bacterium]
MVASPPATGGQGFSHSAVRCLAQVALHHGITTSAERLIHDYALPADEPDDLLLLRMARDLGLRAAAKTPEWRDFLRLRAVAPLLARLKNGNTVVVFGFEGEGAQKRVVVLDPMTSLTTRLLVPADAFRESWSGVVLLVKRVWGLTDESQPFGLAWFIPELLREGRVFRDVALAAVSLQVLGLAVPIFLQLVIDKVMVHQSYATLYVLTAGVVASIVFETAIGFLRQYLVVFATNKIDLRLAVKVFAHLLSLPVGYFEGTCAGVTVRNIQQIEKIRQFLTGNLFFTALDASSLFIFLPLLLLYSIKLTLVALTFTVLIGVVLWLFLGPFRQRLGKLYEAESQRQAMMVETVSGMRTIKALALEPLQRRRWDQRAASAVKGHGAVARIAMSANALTGGLDKLCSVAILAVGVQCVFDQSMTAGALIAFNMLAGRVTRPLVQIVSLIQDYQETALSVQMLAEVMNRPPERRTAGVRPDIQGRIQFEEVTFRYGASATPALSGVSFDMRPGCLVGVVGRSGSGKSTLARLIQGLYPVEEGIIRLDGIDIREIDLVHLRQNIGVVLQDSFLFRGTVRENIAVTKPDAAFEDIVAVAQLAGADEFIEHLPQGYDTPLEEGATNLSGGQKQRIAIARALLPQPRFLIFDEATSALDPDSEAIVMENLGRIRQNRTILLISHRLSTLVPCDAILVLDKGRIVDVASHADLLARCGIYQHLWNRQNRG